MQSSLNIITNIWSTLLNYLFNFDIQPQSFEHYEVKRFHQFLWKIQRQKRYQELFQYCKDNPIGFKMWLLSFLLQINHPRKQSRIFSVQNKLLHLSLSCSNISDNFPLCHICDHNLSRNGVTEEIYPKTINIRKENPITSWLSGYRLTILQVQEEKWYKRKLQERWWLFNWVMFWVVRYGSEL